MKGNESANLPTVFNVSGIMNTNNSGWSTSGRRRGKLPIPNTLSVNDLINLQLAPLHNNTNDNNKLEGENV